MKCFIKHSDENLMNNFFIKWKFLFQEELKKRILFGERTLIRDFFLLSAPHDVNIKLWGQIRSLNNTDFTNVSEIAEVRDISGVQRFSVYFDNKTGKLVFPFDPFEIYENMLNEEYYSNDVKLKRYSRYFYYMFKNLIPKQLLLSARKNFAKKALKEDVFPKWPIDDTLLRLEKFILYNFLRLNMLEKFLFIWFWPSNYKYVVVLTHDVESSAGLKNVLRISKIEEEMGFRSSFNFVLRKYEIPRKLLSYLENRGFEVGIHGFNHDGRLFSNFNIFKRRVYHINKIAREWGIKGFRSPSTFRNVNWMRYLDFMYDSSFFDTDPFEPQPGGTLSIFPFMLGKLVELPITMPQDHTLFVLLGMKDISVWVKKAEFIKRHNGLMLLNTHPDPGYLGDPIVEKKYIEFLEYLKKDEGMFWNPLPYELAEWWKMRAQLEVSQLDGNSSLKGVDPRLTLAFLVLKGDKLGIEYV